MGFNASSHTHLLPFYLRGLGVNSGFSMMPSDRLHTLGRDPVPIDWESNPPAAFLSWLFCSPQVIYCDQTCQKMHWFTHKKVCKTFQAERERQEEEAAMLRQQQSNGALNPAAIRSLSLFGFIISKRCAQLIFFMSLCVWVVLASSDPSMIRIRRHIQE